MSLLWCVQSFWAGRTFRTDKEGTKAKWEMKLSCPERYKRGCDDDDDGGVCAFRPYFSGNRK